MYREYEGAKGVQQRAEAPRGVEGRQPVTRRQKTSAVGRRAISLAPPSWRSGLCYRRFERVLGRLGIARGAITGLVLGPVRLQGRRVFRIGHKAGGHGFQAFGVLPGAAQPSEAQGHQDADGKHAGIAQLAVVAGRIHEGAEAGMVPVYKVDQVFRHGVQARGERFVFHDALELETGSRGLPRDGVAGFDVKLDEEQGRDGRQLGQRGRERSGGGS